MKYKVYMLEGAELDVVGIYAYIREQASFQHADGVVDALEDLVDSLSQMPERGNVPKELQDIGINEYLEVHYKPYRVIYRVVGKRVIVYAVLDGRRDMQSLLERRLLR